MYIKLYVDLPNQLVNFDACKILLEECEGWKTRRKLWNEGNFIQKIRGCPPPKKKKLFIWKKTIKKEIWTSTVSLQKFSLCTVPQIKSKNYFDQLKFICKEIIYQDKKPLVPAYVNTCTTMHLLWVTCISTFLTVYPPVVCLALG